MALTSKAQHEVLSPLSYRGNFVGDGATSTKNSGNVTINGQFFYNLDTLELPLFDDFCTNKFQPYTAEETDPNVTSEFYYSILDMSDVPMPLGTVYTDFPTYKIEVNVGAETQDTIWFASENFKYNTLSSFPIDNYGTFSGYPPYVILDTIDVVGDQDTIWLEDNLYIQDTARVYIVDIDEDEFYWVDHQAFHNYTRAVNPWSLGVASFDGLDETGYPYAINSTFSDYADHLTSKAVNLNYSPNDSIYFSFLFQAAGFCDAPEIADSLILQFLNVDTQLWENVWGTEGVPLDDFKLVHFRIIENKYLQNGFKFRFRNFGGLSGDLDNWHIDYVNLRRFSGYQDTLVKDFAIVYPIPTLLETFTAIPWKHFRNSPSNKMSSNLELVVRNGSNLPENNQPGDLKVYYDGNLEHTYTFPGQALSNGDLNYAPRTVYNSFHDLGSVYEFTTTMTNDTTVTFDYEFAASAPFAQLSNANDTTRGQQIFANYYAYDDGSAEAAYGINGNQARLAYKFEMLEEDSLVAVQMHFVPTVYDHSDKIFLLTVWNDNNGVPGQLLYQDNFFFPSMPEYRHDRNIFTTYFFQDSIKIAVPQTFYVGWRQIEDDRLNIGFDFNTDSQDKIFYSINNEISWLNSTFTGSLMMRPVVSSKMDYQLSTLELEEERKELVVYPNPFTNELKFSFVDEGTVELYSLDGRRMLVADWESSVDVSSLNSGMFIAVVLNKNKEMVNTFKITKE